MCGRRGVWKLSFGAIQRRRLLLLRAVLPAVSLAMMTHAGHNETCNQALDAAAEAMEGLDRLNAARREAGKPVTGVDLALHLGEVLYGNVGPVDRLDFTVIGPVVNEVARIETLCELLGRKVLVSAELAAAASSSQRLEPLGTHTLRGVRDPREIYGLYLGSKT